MKKSDFVFVNQEEKESNEQIRQSLTYWKDTWRRLKKNYLAMGGLVVIIIITLIAIFGPFFTPYSYSDQRVGFYNIPPRIDIFEMEDGTCFYFNGAQYDMYSSDSKGRLIDKLDESSRDIPNRKFYFEYEGEIVTLDYSYKLDEALADENIDFSITYKGVEYKHGETMSNKLFPWGSDRVGRDVLTRVMYGARISLFVALVAAVVNLFIGVLYGSISGLEGGKVDNVMMRIIDVINSIPLILYVILIMVVLNRNDMFTVILTLGLVYWVSMARLVRGQVLGLKNQEFVLAARAIGVPKSQIIFRHLIPNAIGPIIVSLTMMIPSAIFTESFLSFIGLGASAPQSSWGTMANDAIEVFRSSFYQLMYPAGAIALTILAFNFFGDGLRSALDPKLRKG